MPLPNPLPVAIDNAELTLHPAPGLIPYGDQFAWRQACAKFGVSHRHKVSGKVYELTMRTLRKIFTDKYAQWQASKHWDEVGDDILWTPPPCTPGVAFLFWYSPTRSLAIPLQIRKGMVSLVRNGGFLNVFLIAY